MFGKLRSRLTFANVASALALFVALSTGGAYAANTIYSSDIVDGEVRAPDIRDFAINSKKLAANTVSSIKVQDGSLTGADVQDASLGGSDVLNGSLHGVDLGDGVISGDNIGLNTITETNVAHGTLGGVHIRNGSVATHDIADENVVGTDIQDSTLNDEDVGQSTHVDFAADIGLVRGFRCVHREITGINAKGDHLLLTPSTEDSDWNLVYSIFYSQGYPAGADAILQACNPTEISAADGITHFNLLVFDAQ